MTEEALWGHLSSPSGSAVPPGLRAEGKELVAVWEMLLPRTDLRAAALALPAGGAGVVRAAAVREACGAEAAGMVENALRLRSLDDLQVAHHRVVFGDAGQKPAFLEGLLEKLGEDHSALLLKLGEALCLLRRQKRWTAEGRDVAQRVLRVYAPLADRLGVVPLRRLLETEAFAFLYPRLQAHCLRVLSRLHSPSVYPAVSMESVVAQLRQKLAQQNIQARVEGRVKTVPAILAKMHHKGLQLSRLGEVHDICALRVIVASSSQCYRVLDFVHSLWKRIPEDLDDYIAHPKENGYQALHTTVQDPEGQLLEVQIRTERMHAQAEFGVCAHWRYKESTAL